MTLILYKSAFAHVLQVYRYCRLPSLLLLCNIPMPPKYPLLIYYRYYHLPSLLLLCNLLGTFLIYGFPGQILGRFIFTQNQ